MMCICKYLCEGEYESRGKIVQIRGQGGFMMWETSDRALLYVIAVQRGTFLQKTIINETKQNFLKNYIDVAHFNITSIFFILQCGVCHATGCYLTVHRIRYSPYAIASLPLL